MTGLQKQRTVADVFRHALKDDRLRLRLGILYFQTTENLQESGILSQKPKQNG